MSMRLSDVQTVMLGILAEADEPVLETALYEQVKAKMPTAHNLPDALFALAEGELVEYYTERDKAQYGFYRLTKNGAAQQKKGEAKPGKGDRKLGVPTL